MNDARQLAFGPLLLYNIERVVDLVLGGDIGLDEDDATAERLGQVLSALLIAIEDADVGSFLDESVHRGETETGGAALRGEGGEEVGLVSWGVDGRSGEDLR